MANKISVILDLATDKAVGGLKGFKQAINDADGAFGKMKAGSKAAFESIKQHASQMALAAGAALVTFGAKGVAAFTDLAIEAGKFRDVSGASLDEASRWIAVGDDIGVSGDQISGAWNKMNIAIGAGKPLLAEYGIELKKTKDGQVDANATFLNAIDTINGIQDPTKRAELAAATFGKGWTSMSELIEQGSGDITAAMAEVSDAQIIDDAELVKAKEYRAAMDKLGDSVKDLAMEVGEELTPAVTVAADALSDLAPAAGAMAKFVGAQFIKIADEAYAFGSTLADIADAIPGVNLSEPIAETLYEQAKLERGTADLVAEYSKGQPTFDEFVASLKEQGLSEHAVNLAMIAYREQLTGVNAVTGEAIDVTDDLSGSTEELMGATDELTGSTETSTLAHWDAKELIDAKKKSDEEAADAAKAHKEAIDDQIEALTGLVGGDIAVRDAQREAKAALEELTTAMETGELGAEELQAATDLAALEMIGAAEAAADYDEKLGNANGVVLDAQGKNELLRDKLQQVADTLAPGSALRLQIQGYIDDLNRIPTSIETRTFITPVSGSRPIVGTDAAGSSWTQPGLHLVGEQGPELVEMPAGAAVYTAGETAAMLNGGSGGQTLNFYSSGPPTLADLAHAFAMLRLTR